MTSASIPLLAVQSIPAADRAPAAAPVISSGHVAALDGIRGIAIIAVLLHHLFEFDIRDVGWLDRIYRIFSVGWIGVDLFFVLSGFLITGILIQTREKPSYMKNFYGRRAVRIFPLYYGILLIGLVTRQLVSGQIWLWTYLSNIQFTLANGWIDQTSGWLKLWQFWSLAVEEHFYLVWPLVILLCPPRRLLQCTLGLALLSFGSRSIYVLTTGRTLTAYLFTPFRLDGLLMGAACAVAMRSDLYRDRLRKLAMPALGICSGLFVLFYLVSGWRMPSPLVATLGYALLAVSFAALIVAAVTRSATHGLRRFTELGVLRFFGRYSYGIYAFHTTVFVFLLPRTASAIWRVVHSHTMASLLAKPIAVAVTVVLALLSWHLYEKHWLRLKRYFEDDAKRSPASTV